MGCNNCGATTTTDCTCEVGQRGSLIRNGNGAPSIISTDLAGDYYIENDSTPAGEFWYFNGTLWTDLGYTVQGPQGAAGASGSSIIHNNTIASSTTALFLTDLMSYTMPLNTMNTNGDEVLIDAYFSVTGTNTGKRVNIVFGSIDIYTPGQIVCFGATQTRVHLQFNITRVSNVSVLVHSFAVKTDDNGYIASDMNLMNISPIAVADLDTNTVVIKSQGLSAASSTVTCYQLKVEYKHKV